ncbi:hypothetical protein [Bradyrhizobium sp. 18]|uniref:hypothetical protein n=1 Tax=Bradyrhizobium sp. 18 TaxID=2782657 RepID=UPI001FF93E3E|nr:hypothetical protein [Bradyrhizobium sp. 18]
MADWLVSNGLHDPMADRRGTYSTRREYRNAIRSEGGILASCVRRFAAVGLKESDEPKAGDVALVLAPARMGRRIVMIPTGSICTSPTMRAVVAPDVGLAGAPLTTIRAWAIHG